MQASVLIYPSDQSANSICCQTVSKELQSAFQDLVSDTSKFGLLCTIKDEAIEPLVTLSPATGSFDNDISLLQPHVKPDAPLYIILRRYETTDAAPFVAVTYVPDTAKVRQKMLFASSRLTLTRELGIERFRETIFATTSEELTKEGFHKHDQHTKLEAPLTEEEQVLGEVKRKEAEEGRGLAERRSHVSSGVKMPITDEALSALKRLGEDGGDNLVQLKINTASELMELASATSTDISSLSTTISATEPRYSFYRYAHTYQGESLSPILFIYTCPSGSKIRERMLYAASSKSAMDVGESEAGIKIEKKIETGSPEDLSQEGIEGDLHPKVETKRAFDRPKRPGRK
ncbi:hypothetical protein F5884DRAFT_677914 [Xylogone sp. PMI_703]|nr:hypothetical protein F5884DRAFT_677914 [Xylogone sp. PMI_703]